MRSLKLALLATVAMGAISSAAYAADLIVDQPVAAAPVVDNNYTFDGAYIGAFVTGTFGGDADDVDDNIADSTYGLGVNFGVNAVMDNLVVGGEIEATAQTDNNYSGQITGKIGGLVSDSVMLYAFSGLGTKTGTSYYVPVGVGAEFAVADNVGIAAEYQYNFDLTDGDQNSQAAKVGLKFHF